MQVTERGEAADSSKRNGGGMRFFLRGLGVILPSILTLWILMAAFRFVDGNIAAPINAGLRFAVAAVADGSDLEPFRPAPEAVQAEKTRAGRLRLDASDPAVRSGVIRANVTERWEARRHLDLAGLALATVAVSILVGSAGGYIGRRLPAAFDSGMLSVPGIRSAYPALKQVVEFLLGSEQQKLSFNRVLTIECPRPRIWSMGLVTGDAAREVRAAVGDAVTVFVPSSPTPFTGWTVAVPREQVRELPITMDEALRYLVSVGVVVPGDKISAEPSNKAVTT
jgi:uncharacterized membrane protein